MCQMDCLCMKGFFKEAFVSYLNRLPYQGIIASGIRMIPLADRILQRPNFDY